MTRRFRVCAAVRCGERVGPRMMFCRHHWARLTDGLRQEIFQTYKPESTIQTAAYRSAASRAIMHLARAERTVARALPGVDARIETLRRFA